MKLVQKLTKLVRKLPDYCAAVIVAAGSSQRMHGTDKIMAPLGDEPVILHSVRAFQQCPLVQEIVVVTRPELLEPVSRLLQEAGMDKVRFVISGGETRLDSVARGLEQVSDRTRLVAIHDGARPLVTAEVIEQAIRKAGQTAAAAPAIGLKDTIKLAKNGVVEQTLKREELFAAQTPQVFDYDLYRAALQSAQAQKLPLTDDCAVAEAFGLHVFLTPGDERNLKVTTPVDLRLAQLFWEETP